MGLAAGGGPVAVEEDGGAGGPRSLTAVGSRGDPHEYTACSGGRRGEALLAAGLRSAQIFTSLRAERRRE